MQQQERGRSQPTLLVTTCRLVHQMLPVLDRDAAEDVVLQATNANGRALRQVNGFLLAYPDGLTSGDSNAPPAIGRLIHVLIKLGVEGVQAPRCLDCHRAVGLPARVVGGRVCIRCDRNRRRKICCRCGRLDKVQQRVADGVLCQRCYCRENRSPCARCGGMFPVAARAPGGEPLCQTCRPTRKAECGECGPGRCAAAATARRNGPGVGAVDAVGHERLPLPPRRIGLTCVSAAATARSEPVRLAGATVPAGSTPTASPYASSAGGGPTKRVPGASEPSPSRRSGRWARSASAATSASGSTRRPVAGAETSGSSSATTRTKMGSAAPVSGSTCSQAAAHARARPALTKTAAARDAS